MTIQWIAALSILLAIGCKTPTSPSGNDLSADNSAGVQRDSLGTYPYSGTCSTDRQVCAYFAPTDLPVFAVRDAFLSAKKSIKIAIYNINIPWYADILRQKMDSGVKVELLQDYKHTVENKGVWRAIGQHQNLVKWRLPVMRGGNPQMHNKIIIIDDSLVLFGSANWTYTGLVGNFENVMAVRNPEVIGKFSAEVDELRAIAKLACETFAKDSNKCGTGQETVEDHFLAMVTTGKLPAINGANRSRSEEGNDGDSPGVSLPANLAKVVDTTKAECKPLWDGLRANTFVPGNLPAVRDLAVFKTCFTDPRIGEKYAKFAGEVSAIEKYSDGTPVLSEPPIEKTVTANGSTFTVLEFPHLDQQRGNFKVYFSGEDNVEYMILRELKAAGNSATPATSFAYLSTNFITNGQFSKELVKLNEKGVRLRVFFDRGRIYDPMFQSQVESLAKLGITHGLGARGVVLAPGPTVDGRQTWNLSQSGPMDGEPELAKKSLSVFDNQLSGAYGANHNKFGIIGYADKNGVYHVKLINGSANWSGMAMRSNDENLVVVEDDVVTAIYLREMVSQLFVYRYGQNVRSTGFMDDLKFLSDKVRCFNAAMGIATACTTGNGQNWQPEIWVPAVMSVKGVPANYDGDRRAWVWVSNWDFRDGKDVGRAIEMFSSDTFEGRWVTSVLLRPKWKMRYKFLTAPKNLDLSKTGVGVQGLQWENGGDRETEVSQYPIMKLDSGLQWR